MVETPCEWADGAKLEEHSKRKHKILREYVFDYLSVRCRLPQQERFRLAIVDGFAGGGRYQCGTPGSPLIFIEELQRAVEAVNTHRSVQGLGAIEVECLLIFNDVAPMQAAISQMPEAALARRVFERVFRGRIPADQDAT
ncbi:three-Cys-motif partner protein TcmP [Bradyrhizobium sp. CB1717]|uniref:three-Cys-motif partner protein TcmP n=1 Tax=Bradyrhizobium sp. CB1717 TaxID=3039154 RepID=UPI0024B12AA4|nr:three-Cys-motif partner protein TcmP [Bradyrhizobium sp. CB1717]WFU25602.1 three-Cys-motif partner protein TcmP [Bradyrhizobium sp. CB1717]